MEPVASQAELRLKACNGELWEATLQHLPNSKDIVIPKDAYSEAFSSLQTFEERLRVRQIN